MKCSVGVAICAAVLIIGSVFAFLAAAGAAFAFLGPAGGQFFDPQILPPGADVRMMRAAAVSGALFIGTLGSFGIVVGIGLIRLWKWARYAAIVLGAAIIVLSVIPALFIAFAPLPPPPAGSREMSGAFRLGMAGFYLFWAAAAGIFVYVMARTATAAQFNGGAFKMASRPRPLSVTIIAWLMIVSGLFTLPLLAWGRLPAVFLGFVMTGLAARMFYVTYAIAYVGIGAGLIRRTAVALSPAIALQSIMLLNAITMAVPGVWRQYQDAMAAVSPMFVNQSGPSGRYFVVFLGAVTAGAFLVFLLRARRSLASTASPAN